MVSTELFLDYARASRKSLAQLRSLRHTHALLEVSYERTIVGGLWHEVFAFLDLPPMAPAWLTMQKVAPPPRDYIAGYDGLVAGLSAPSPMRLRGAARRS